MTSFFQAALGDSNSGLLANAAQAAKDTALAKTADNGALHPILQGILGGAPAVAEPTPVTGEASAAANLPKSDTAAPSFVQKNKKWLIAAAVGLGALLVLPRLFGKKK